MTGGLRELAEKATPGPWHVRASRRSVGYMLNDARELLAEVNTIGRAGSFEADTAFIAAVSPEVVLALCDVAEAATRAVILEYDPTMDGAANTEMARRASTLRDALARLSAAAGSATPKGAGQE